MSYKKGYKKKNYNKKNYNKKGYNKRNSYDKSLTSFAYRMGQIECGLNNPESKISASYLAGTQCQSNKNTSLF